MEDNIENKEDIRSSVEDDIDTTKERRTHLEQLRNYAKNMKQDEQQVMISEFSKVVIVNAVVEEMRRLLRLEKALSELKKEVI